MRADLLLILVLLTPSAVLADDEPQDPSSYEVVVTAKRGAEDPFDSDRSVSVLRRTELDESSPRTTPEALWDAHGVFVQQTNHGGGAPIVRGAIGPQLLLLVDGVRLSNSVYRTGPTQYLNLVDPLLIDRLEVLRGPGSVLYGSDAMGGVIQMLLPVPKATPAAEGSLRYASADRGTAWHGHVQTGAGDFALRAGLSHKLLYNLDAGGDLGRQRYSGYGNWSAAGTAAQRLGEHLELRVGYLFGRIDRAGRTDKLVDSQSLQFYDNDDHLTYARLIFAVPGWSTNGEVTLSFQRFFERKEAFGVAADLRTRETGIRDEVEALTGGADLQMTTRLIDNRVRIQYGLTAYRDWVSAERKRWTPLTPWTAATDRSYPDGSTYDNFGAHVLATGDPLRLEGGHILRVSGGYRLHGMAGGAGARADLPAVDFSHLGHVFLAGLQYLQSDINAALTFSQGFRAPNLQEAVMLGDTGKYFHIPNDDLVPERADTLELLVRARFGRVRFGGSGYVSWLSDLIKREETTWNGEAEVDGKPVAHNVNGREGRLFGTEWQARADIVAGLSIRGQITWTWGEEQTADGGVPLTRIPPLFGQVTARYELPPFGVVPDGFVECFVRAAARQDRLSVEDERDVRIPDGGTPGWWTLNLRAGAVVADHFRVGLSVENILDAEYKYHGSGIYSPGLNVIGTVAARL